MAARRNAEPAGEALAEQRKFDEAEALLVPAYESLRRNGEVPAARVRAARDRIERLYTLSKQPGKARAWRASLTATP